VGLPTRRSLAQIAGSLAVLAVLTARVAVACDSAACAAAMRYSEGEMAPGGWRVDVSFRYVNQGRRLNGRDSADEVLRPRIDFERGGLEAATHEELSAAMSFLSVEVSRGLTPSLSAVATLPLYRRNEIQSVHLDAVPSADHGHGATGLATWNTARGLGDAQLGLRWAPISSARHSLAGGLGVKLPTGPSGHAGIDGVVDPMLQTGTGAADLVGSLQYSFKISRTVLSATASMQRTTANGRRYRYGDDRVVAVSVSGPLGPRFTGQVQLKLQHAGRHRFEGGDVPSTGLTLVQLAQGLRVRVAPALTLYGTVQLPAYVRVNAF
jgi:hypothetical protein